MKKDMMPLTLAWIWPVGLVIVGAIIVVIVLDIVGFLNRNYPIVLSRDLGTEGQLFDINAPDEKIYIDDKGWSSYLTILADENDEGGLQFYISKETGRLKVVMDSNTDMNEAAEIFFNEILKPMVDGYIDERLQKADNEQD